MAPVVVKLKEPVQFGSELIEQLELRPTGRAMRDFSLVNKDGAVIFNPYDCAVVGVKMSGRLVGAEKIVDMMAPVDLMEVFQVVMGFIGGSPQTGSTVSQ